MDVVDDSENDSDYVPEANTDDGEQPNDIPKPLASISLSRKRKVNSVWEEMQKEDKLSVSAKMSKAVSSYARNGSEIVKVVKSSKRKKDELILSNIFGKSVAKRLAAVVGKGNNKKPTNIKEDTIALAKNVKKKTKVVETKKFAGKEITIERTVVQASSTNPSSGSSKPTAGLDAVLNTMKGPKLVSTVGKSSVDWDNFKEKEGIEDDLAVAAKEGYLTKKEFLERCDARVYEVDRASRKHSGGSA